MSFPRRITRPLAPYEENVTSQCGEDGVIRRVLELVGEPNRWCVDVGAWDGVHASNTWAFIAREGYSGVLVECDPARFAQLERTHAGREGDVLALRRRVGFDGPDRLDRVLAPTPVPRDVDLLSIDVDGVDYHVWAALEDYRPKVVVIEFNPTIPNEVDYVQPRDARVTHGSSLRALARLAREKGYRLVHATVVNAIFVDGRYFARFGIEDDSPQALRANLAYVTWLFQTYDGELHLAGYDRLRWHDVPLRAERMQVIPRALRTFPADFSRAQRVGWAAWRAVREPRELRRRAAGRRRRD